jgi:nitroreductase
MSKYSKKIKTYNILIYMNELIKNRRSIRKFKSDEPVTREQLNQLLEAAMLAPSACNSRPWEFIAITKRETLDEIARIHPYARMCETATAAIIVVAIPQTDPMPADYYPQDCGAATQNILLEAVSLGLGTCWCGVYPRDERIADLRKLSNIENSKIPFCVIAIGTPAEEPASRGFFEKAKVIYIE